MKVAITGISSFFATSIMPLLEKDDEISQILGLDIVEPKFQSAKLNFKKRDVRDPQLVDDLKGYDAIIHLAFIVTKGRDTKRIYSINVDGSKNVFDCALKAGIKKIIHASSAAGYGSFPDNPIPIKENHSFRIMTPRFYYNETKVLVERYLDEIEKQNPDIVITRFRPHIVVGLNMENPLKTIFSSKRILAFNPSDPFQLVWVNDVAQAFYLALKKDAHGAFNLGATPATFKEIGKHLNLEVKTISPKLAIGFIKVTFKLRIHNSDPGWIRSGMYPIVVDSSKVKEVLGLKPKYEDTLGIIRAFWDHLKERGEV